LAGERRRNFSEAIQDMASTNSRSAGSWVQVVVVVGGGNLFSGLPGSERGIEVRLEIHGMLATVINALALQDALESSASPRAFRARLHGAGGGGFLSAVAPSPS